MKRFGLTGAAGYIAPRHLKAIQETGNTLDVALDPFDSVGVMDAYFPRAEFFTQPELFEQYLHTARDEGRGLDYLSICAPNYLHGPHIRMGLRAGADALCEKPLVLSPEELRGLAHEEQRTGQRVWTILQLRVHEALTALKDKLDQEGHTGKREVDLTYVTSRGTWYLRSWKGRTEQSGGWPRTSGCISSIC
ncbi:Gfo/Idh/MocA family oxidoreductase [Deinococcus multiflagellatus]|uniref:Gfo/Idh/MocA family oxidoreductase n=1 Tax=Deinococcus multiflagellatus TaxID=1656887 RepID=A0ABW1ZLJ4_9DEIO